MGSPFVGTLLFLHGWSSPTRCAPLPLCLRHSSSRLQPCSSASLCECRSTSCGRAGHDATVPVNVLIPMSPRLLMAWTLCLIDRSWMCSLHDRYVPLFTGLAL